MKHGSNSGYIPPISTTMNKTLNHYIKIATYQILYLVEITYNIRKRKDVNFSNIKNNKRILKIQSCRNPNSIKSHQFPIALENMILIQNLIPFKAISFQTFLRTQFRVLVTFTVTVTRLGAIP